MAGVIIEWEPSLWTNKKKPIKKDFFQTKKSTNVLCICYITEKDIKEQTPQCPACTSLEKDLGLTLKTRVKRDVLAGRGVLVEMGVSIFELYPRQIINLSKIGDSYWIMSVAEERIIYAC